MLSTKVSAWLVLSKRQIHMTRHAGCSDRVRGPRLRAERAARPSGDAAHLPAGRARHVHVQLVL